MGLWQRTGAMGKRKGPGWDKTLKVFREAYQPGNERNRTRTTREIMYPSTPRA